MMEYLTNQHFSSTYTVAAKKSLGQNFLIDSLVIGKIIEAFCHSYKKGPILEIGPGTGALTHLLLERFQDKLYLLEYDQTLLQYLKNHLTFPSPKQLIQADALHYPITELFKNEMHYNIISNLPYNIGTALILKLLNTNFPCDLLILMVQKEVAQQICATTNDGKKRGRLTVFCEYFCKQRDYLFDVSPHAFFPSPKVDSAVIRLKPHPQRPSQQQWAKLEILTAQGFQQRRKTLSNALKSLKIGPDQFKKAHVDPMKRAENLELHEWMQLVNALQE